MHLGDFVLSGPGPEIDFIDFKKWISDCFHKTPTPPPLPVVLPRPKNTDPPIYLVVVRGKHARDAVLVVVGVIDVVIDVVS